MRRRQAAALLALLLAVPPAARADPPGHDASRPAAPPQQAALTVTLRGGEHTGFGRIVFEVPPGVEASAEAQGGQVVVRIAGAAFAIPRWLPHNLAGIDVAAGQAVLRLTPGATWHAQRLPDKLVVDLLDPPSPEGQPGGEAPPPGVAPAAPSDLWSGPPPRHVAAPTAPIAATPQPPQPAKAAAPDAPPPAAERPVAAPPAVATPALAPPAPRPAAAPAADVAQAPLPPPAPGLVRGAVTLAVVATGQTLFLPFAPSTGAAAFRRGDEAVVVFDEARPLDLAALRDNPTFAAARVQLLSAATELRLALPPDATLRLARIPGGWSLTQTKASTAAALAPIRPSVGAGRVRFAAAAAGQVVSVPDPATGGVLLIGTQDRAGEAIAVTRRAPDYTLIATLQGVAIEPLSDDDVLRVEPPGFVLEGGPGRALAVDASDGDATAAAEAARMSRRWDLPPLPAAALLQRLQGAAEAAAEAPPQARTAARLEAVQAQLALGLGAEAEALANLVIAEDPRAAEGPDAAGLAAVGALLAGRDADSGAIEDARLTGSDEVALWRAVRRAQSQADAPDAAAVFAALNPLLLAYPQPLRDRLLPLAAETMVLGGERAAAKRLLDARKDDATLDYARALLDAADGHAAPALATLDRLAQSNDRRLRARAASRAIELRLRSGGLRPAQAADALDKLIYAWRGDAQELALRLRVAALRTEAGEFRAALALLRETASAGVADSWPEQRGALHERMQSVFAAALEADAKTPLSPFDLVALLDENPDLLPAGEAGRALAARLADRLAALDLPERAGPVLQKLLDGTPPGAARAELGARLAALRLADHDPTGALTALSASATPDLPAPLTERRTILFARATAARGELQPAVAALAALDTPAADEARAGLLEEAKDWPAATGALAAYAARTLPPQGQLDEAAARTLLRLASAAAQAGDETTLARLRAEQLARIPAGPVADMVKLLTESPVRNLPDLSRVGQEATLARNLPVALRALGAPPR